MKNSFNRLILHIAEEKRIVNLEIEKVVLQTEMQREKEWKKKQNRASKNCKMVKNVFEHNWIGVPEVGVKNKATDIFKEVMDKNFPKLMKNNKTQIQEAQRTKTD